MRSRHGARALAAALSRIERFDGVFTQCLRPNATSVTASMFVRGLGTQSCCDRRAEAALDGLAVGGGRGSCLTLTGRAMGGERRVGAVVGR